MKKLVVLLIISGFAIAGFAKKSDTKSHKAANIESAVIKGKVIDFKSGEALVGVEISVEGTDTKAYTDFDGSFEIKNVATGKCNLIASYISYEKSLIEKFDVEKNNQVNIKLRESN